eukprot:1421952-Ditylum_brightwellii.AAC.1
MVLPKPSHKKIWSFGGNKASTYMPIRYRFQKNKDNGQTIKYSKSSNTKLCPVRAGLIIRRRAQRLSMRVHTPIAVYSSSLKRKAQYITDNHIEH